VGLDLRSIVRRCVRGFHAALYGEPLSEVSTVFMTTPPLPEARGTAAGVSRVSLPDVVLNFVAELKRNRVTDTLDGIMCRNGKCLYQCVWSQADDGRFLCIYGFDLYGWKDLGDDVRFRARGCVGAYRPEGAVVPRGATRATRLEFPFPNRDVLDPFGG
jgi:hypothetical protein